MLRYRSGMNRPSPTTLARLGASLAPIALLITTGCSGKGNADVPTGTFQDATAAVARNDYDGAAKALRAVLIASPNDKEALFLAGRVSLESGDAYGALNALGRVSGDPAYTAKARPLLAKAYLAAGQPDQALKLLGEGPFTDPLSYSVATAASAATGNFKMTEAMLDKGLAQFPQAPELLALDGMRAVAFGNNEKAATIAAGLRKSAPDNFDAMLFVGQFALERRQFDVATEAFTHLHQLRPHHQAAMLGLATVARARGDDAGARNWIGQARKAAPDNAMVAMAAAELALAAGNGNEALKILGDAGDQLDRFPRLGLLKGMANTKVGNNDAAIAQLTAFFARGSEDPRGRLALAALQAQAGDKISAWMTLKPLAKVPNAPPEALRLAADLAAANHDPAAAQYAQRAAGAGHADPDSKAMLAADAAIRAGKWHDADAIYTRVLANPQTNQAVLLNNAAYVKIELGTPAAAVPLARRAMGLAPNDPTVLDTLGWALFKSAGASAEVRDLLSRASKLSPDNSTISQHLAAVASHG